MSQEPLWASHPDPINDIVHIVPNDGYRHYAVMDCPCDPTIELSNRPDGSVSTIFLHNTETADVDTARQYREPPA